MLFKPLLITFIVVMLASTALAQKKIGFVFSGGGSRIAEEVAVMEALLTGSYPGGSPMRPSFVSGTSAGSICAVALNAIVQTMNGASRHPFTMEDVKNMVFNMTVGSVIDITPLGIYKIMTHNVKEGYLLDTTPLRHLLTKYLVQMGYKYMSDLYLDTCLSTVDSGTGLPVRVCSDDPSARDLLIVDVLMASAAMPVIFPSQQIAGLGGSEVQYVDGGVGIDMIPTDPAYLRHLDEVYIITRQWELNNATAMPQKIKDIKILYNAVNTFNNFLQGAFLAGLSTAASAKIPSYSYIPVLDRDFGVLDFDQGKLMYELTRTWTKSNAPICMNC